MVMVMLSVVVVVIYSALVRSHQSTYEGMGALRLVVPPPGGHIKRAQNSGNAYLVKRSRTIVEHGLPVPWSKARRKRMVR